MIEVKQIGLRRFDALAGYARSPQIILYVKEIEWYATTSERLVGMLTHDRIDHDFGWVILGRDERRRFRAIDVNTSLPDFVALRGDPSDKIPGAPGVGAAGAASLIQRYGSLEAALDDGRFPAMADTLRLYKAIAIMDRRAPIPSLRSQKPTWDKAAALAREWGLNQLEERLEKLAIG